MSTVKKIFAINLYTAKENIKERWFVRVKVPDFKKGTFVWRKCYGDINKFNTVEERLVESKKLIDHIELTQEYKNIQGSRRPGYINENYYTDTIFQLTAELKQRKHRLRLSSYRKYKGLINNLEIWLIKTGRPNLPIGAFTNDHANAFLEYTKIELLLSNVTHNQHLVILKSLFAVLIVKRVVVFNPFAGITGMSKQTTAALYFSNEQKAILKYNISDQDPWLWIFCQFIYYCFIRPGELRNIKLSDIRFDEGKITVRPEVSKNKKEQTVSIPETFLQILLKLKLHTMDPDFYLFSSEGGPGTQQIGVNNMKLRHQKILKGLNFSIRHKLYSWKHTGAVNCARAGMDLKDLQLQLRHHSLDQVNDYLAGMLVHESSFIKYSFPEI